MTFKWIAILNDGTIIPQFNEEKVEIPFSEVEANKSELKIFRIEAANGEYYEVDFTKNTIDCNGKLAKDPFKKKDVCDLIYSRRNQVRMSIGGSDKILDSRVIHRIGIKSGNDEVVVEIFPGLNMAAKSKIVKQKIKGKETIDDFTDL